VAVGQRPSLNEFWFRKAKTDEEREEIAKAVLNASHIIEPIRDYIEQEFFQVARVTRADYSNKEWSHEQAHRNGQMDALETIWKLFP
jgi:hypothetical protein